LYNTTKENTTKFVDPSSLKSNSAKIYKSKIANVPTPGYSGHTSIFIKPISYLNKDRIENEENFSKTTIDKNLGNGTLGNTFQQMLSLEKPEITELPYIVGYRGFREHVKAGNYYGKNFRETSLTTINKPKNI